LILALAILVFGIVGTIKIAAWLLVFIIIAAIIVALAVGLGRRAGRRGI
jgi:hypothetical protein